MSESAMIVMSLERSSSSSLLAPPCRSPPLLRKALAFVELGERSERDEVAAIEGERELSEPELSLDE